MVFKVGKDVESHISFRESHFFGLERFWEGVGSGWGGGAKADVEKSEICWQSDDLHALCSLPILCFLTAT